MRIAIRADASSTLGLGHIKRCLSLAAALRQQGADVLFVCQESDIALGSLLEKEGVAYALIPSSNAPHSSMEDWRLVSKILKTFQPQCIVVDHYGLDATWHEMAAHATRAAIVAIDDMANRPLACDLLVDHNHAESHEEKYRGVLKASVLILGGPRYALLAPSYAQSPRYTFSSEVRSIGISMGGTDAPNWNSLALAVCRQECGFTGEIEIATTSANPNLPELEHIVRQDPHLTLSVDLPDLTSFYARHDLQIGAGGGSTWERCCIGAPSVVVQVADNQRPVLEPLARHEILVWSEGTRSAIASAIQSLLLGPQKRQLLSENGKKWVDGKGCQRTSEAILQLCKI